MFLFSYKQQILNFEAYFILAAILFKDLLLKDFHRKNTGSFNSIIHNEISCV